ncbi:ATP-dependent DNA helicase [Candidimonas sp. SYP-B2681]|uniref:ATP-dependent DNA helicase n=1 Tax=Candidimonas sp. SYP-B2681 TaxID=2497686 RepID=UPI000F8901B3|nr:ATP-dependent DNA helicase [Candidimonas sp. SYP-B2681]RTZ47649.1 ATP-dependent DNA helicase [Candidimonas sp. SYP-B2681]
MTYTVSVRALCEFTAKSGDLDLRFTPSPSAQEGIEGHAAVRAKRAPGYQSEISLSGEYKNLLVRGRADGYDPALNRVEEIKTFRGQLEAVPANHRALHWAQAKVYAHLLCVSRKLPEIQVALVYYDIVQREETVLVQTCQAAILEEFFAQQSDLFIDWAEQEVCHRLERDRELQTLPFPHQTFRRGQRQLAETVYKAARQNRCLMAQAPTGIGKTIGTLFPLLKACPTAKLDKIFFLTAKTSGRQLALDALSTIGNKLNESGRLRVQELTAKDKTCEHPDKACHGESCALAKGFYDRLPAARLDAVKAARLDKAALRQIALEHEVCPYWLGQELAKWSDVIVGDYNYFFDSSASLYSLTSNNQWRVGILVDEAHNLLERARKMYSAELNEYDLNALRQSAPAALKKTLNSLARSWRDVSRDQLASYRAYDAIPTKFHTALLKASVVITDYLAEDPHDVNLALQRFNFDVLHFLRLAEVFGSHSVFDISLTPSASTSRRGASGAKLCLRNLIPAPFLETRFTASETATLFSATLSPWEFYRDTLGLPDNTAWVDVESPFDAEQLKVRIVEQVSTRYLHRAQSLAPIAQIMGRQYLEQPGNYLSYFSSFEYLEQAAHEFMHRFPDIPVWTQIRSMDEAAKEQFLDRFKTNRCGIGFAVLGGAFAEGIDLPGQQLIGAFVSTLGLPQVNPVNERLKQCMSTTFGQRCGYDYTYLYPGIQKVVQAAGRVIRSNTDRGVLYLIDDRFARPQVRRLFPAWWEIQSAPVPALPPADRSQQNMLLI